MIKAHDPTRRPVSAGPSGGASWRCIRSHLSFFIASVVSLYAHAARAEPAIVDEVERLDIERGEVEIEWHSALASAVDAEGSTGIHFLSGEYGVSDKFAVGFEFSGETAEGEEFSADSIVLQAKYIGTHSGAFGWGAQLSLGPSLRGGKGEIELEILAETRLGAATISAETSIETELGETDEPALRYAIRSDWPQDWGKVGFEAGGELNKVEDEVRRHWIGPAVAFSPWNSFLVDLSYLRGLNDATPPDQFRIELRLRL